MSRLADTYVPKEYQIGLLRKAFEAGYSSAMPGLDHDIELDCYFHSRTFGTLKDEFVGLDLIPIAKAWNAGYDLKMQDWKGFEPANL